LKIKLSETEKEIILKHDPSCRGRALLEMEIVSALIRAAVDAGYYFEVDGEEDDVSTTDNLKRVVFNLDEATLLLCGDDEKPKGWIKLVFGNDGYDLISDYTTNLEAFLKPVNDLANFWGGQ
jgi:hypothetical protein